MTPEEVADLLTPSTIKCEPWVHWSYGRETSNGAVSATVIRFG